MSADSPASILFDELGNPVGVIQDGTIYRLQVQSTLTDGTNIIGTPANPISTQSGFGQSDAFARFRVSEPFTVFDSKQLNNSSPLFWDDQQVSGSGTSSTFLTDKAATQINVSSATAGTRVRQTFRRFNYQPGKSHLITMTGILGSGASGITRRIGYFDSNNGLFFELNGTTMNVVVRTSTSGVPVDTRISQSSWNIDKLDGTGPSGVTLDTSKTQIFIIDFQWLGTGRIRFGLFIGSSIIYVHQIVNANTNTQVYMSVPNCPLRYEISNDGTGASANLVHICTSVISEGGRENNGFLISADDDGVPLITLNNTNNYVLLAIRLGATTPYASIDPITAYVVCSSNAAYRYALVLNPTIVGTALSFSPITNSTVELANPDNSTTITGGTTLFSGYDQAGGGHTGNTEIILANSLTLGQNIAGVSDILCLVVQRVTGTTETFYGSLTWRETI
jgi:hypothetical protein